MERNPNFKIAIGMRFCRRDGDIVWRKMKAENKSTRGFEKGAIMGLLCENRGDMAHAVQ